VPLNPKFLNEIEHALQGHEVITEYENKDLKNELYFFTGGENIELLFESKDLCSCGNRRYKKNSKCKEYHENLLKELVPLCGSCKKRKILESQEKDKCKMCNDFIEMNNSNPDLKIICKDCSNKWGQI
ncbi:17777_t:CDS:2, partial [Racocetra persica]